MGHRLSRIVTRTGDDGSTGLGDGSRIPKNAPIIQVLGDLDELNSLLGLVLCESLPEEVAEVTACLQQHLFDLGGELSIPGSLILKEKQLEQLEVWVTQFNTELPPLKEFILPGGCRSSALLQVARSVCRRAERSLAGLSSNQRSPLTLPYLNRLSDLLFILARFVNLKNGVTEPLWHNKRL